MPDDEQEPITPVCFRKWRENGDIIAIFPGQEGGHTNLCGSYMHIGQHGDCNPFAMITGSHPSTEPAMPEEYADLKAELEAIGYRLKVYKRIPWRLYWWA